MPITKHYVRLPGGSKPLRVRVVRPCDESEDDRMMWKPTQQECWDAIDETQMPSAVEVGWLTDKAPACLREVADAMIWELYQSVEAGESPEY